MNSHWKDNEMAGKWGWGGWQEIMRCHIFNVLGNYIFSLFLAATKQLYEWFSPSVCLSVTPFWLCSYHRIIRTFSGVITNNRSDVHTKGQGERSKVKVTEVNTQISRFRTITPVWFHIWWWNEMMHRAWCCLGEVPYCFSRSSIRFQGHTDKKSSIL